MGFGAKSDNNVAALRARVGVGPASSKPSARPKEPELRAPPPRPAAKDNSDELAAKAEKIAQQQHETPLLKREPKNDRAKEYTEKKKGGMLIQVLLVMIIAGGVAVALDPQLLSQVQTLIHWEEIKYKLGLD